MAAVTGNRGETAPRKERQREVRTPSPRQKPRAARRSFRPGFGQKGVGRSPGWALLAVLFHLRDKKLTLMRADASRKSWGFGGNVPKFGNRQFGVENGGFPWQSAAWDFAAKLDSRRRDEGPRPGVYVWPL